MLPLAPVATHVLALALVVAPGWSAQAPPEQAPTAQAPAQPAKPAEPAAAERGARPPAGNRNVRLTIAVTSSADAEPPARKVVTMTILDGDRGSIRSGDQQRRNDGAVVAVGTKVDARPQVLDDGRIRVFIILEHTPAYGTSLDSSGQVQLTAVLADSKPTVVSETSDPAGNRKLAVELTATVVR